METPKYIQNGIGLPSYAVYVCDGYKRVGFITRWNTMDFATSLDAKDLRPFTVEEAMEAHKVLNFHGIAHSILAMTDIF